jgi:profilin
LVIKYELIDLKKKKTAITSFMLQLEQTDVDTLVNAFNQPTILRKKGLYFNEIYYTCIRADNESIYAKEVRRYILFFFY